MTVGQCNESVQHWDCKVFLRSEIGTLAKMATATGVDNQENRNLQTIAALKSFK
jgi:hypothetical protein